MDKGLKGRKVVRVLFLGSHPQIDFHPGRVRFASGQGPLDRISDFKGVGVARALHHYEVGVIVLVQDLVVFAASDY